MKKAEVIGTWGTWEMLIQFWSKNLEGRDHFIDWRPRHRWRNNITFILGSACESEDWINVVGFVNTVMRLCTSGCINRWTWLTEKRTRSLIHRLTYKADIKIVLWEIRRSYVNCIHFVQDKVHWISVVYHCGTFGFHNWKCNLRLNISCWRPCSVEFVALASCRQTGFICLHCERKPLGLHLPEYHWLFVSLGLFCANAAPPPQRRISLTNWALGGGSFPKAALNRLCTAISDKVSSDPFQTRGVVNLRHHFQHRESSMAGGKVWKTKCHKLQTRQFNVYGAVLLLQCQNYSFKLSACHVMVCVPFEQSVFNLCWTSTSDEFTVINITT
jgi:hypothetical protein